MRGSEIGGGFRLPRFRRNSGLAGWGLGVRSILRMSSQLISSATLRLVRAMKMENVLRAERDGVVKKVFAKPGDSLAVDAVIMEFAWPGRLKGPSSSSAPSREPA